MFLDNFLAEMSLGPAEMTEIAENVFFHVIF